MNNTRGGMARSMVHQDFHLLFSAAASCLYFRFHPSPESTLGECGLKVRTLTHQEMCGSSSVIAPLYSLMLLLVAAALRLIGKRGQSP